MRSGYLRLGGGAAEVEAERIALHTAGCVELITEERRSAWRPALDRHIRSLGLGDTLVIWRMDRLAGTLPELLRRLDEIEARGAHVIGLMEGFDSRDSASQLAKRVIKSIQPVEQSGRRERIEAGLEVARREYGQLGRPRALSEPDREAALNAIINGDHSVTSAAKLYGVSSATISRLVKKFINK
jgi:DNA invertase Pin-like site-specific DNA recombinase